MVLLIVHFVRCREIKPKKERIYNQTLELEHTKRTTLIRELLGSKGENVYIEPNIRGKICIVLLIRFIRSSRLTQSHFFKVLIPDLLA